MTVIYKVLNNLDSIKEISCCWDNLAEESPHKSPVLSHAWLSVFFECRISVDQKWFVVVAYINDTVVGILPVVSTSKRLLGLTYKVLSLPGDDHTISVDMLVKVGLEEQVSLGLIDKAFSHEPRSRSFFFHRVDSCSNSYTYNVNKSFVISQFCEDGAFITSPENISDFRAGLTRNFRLNINKANNKFIKMNGANFYVNENHSDTKNNMDKIIAVESSGWKGEANTAIASAIGTEMFYRKLADSLAAKGWLSCHFLEAEEKILAANFSIKFSHSMLIWKTSYNDKYKKISPGGLIMDYLVEYSSHHLDIDRIDAMSNDEWHKKWNMSYRAFNNYWVYKKTIVGFIFMMCQKIKLMLKGSEVLRGIKNRFFS